MRPWCDTSEQPPPRRVDGHQGRAGSVRRPDLAARCQLGSAGDSLPGSESERPPLIVLPTRQARRAAPRATSPNAPRAISRPFRDRWRSGSSSCSYVSTCASRSGVGTSGAAGGLSLGKGVAGVTHRFKKANVSEPHTGQRSASCSSSQSRQRRAIPSRIAASPRSRADPIIAASVFVRCDCACSTSASYISTVAPSS